MGGGGASGTGAFTLNSILTAASLLFNPQRATLAAHKK